MYRFSLSKRSKREKFEIGKRSTSVAGLKGFRGSFEKRYVNICVYIHVYISKENRMYLGITHRRKRRIILRY